jgi:hypothetical protein
VIRLQEPVAQPVVVALAAPSPSLTRRAVTQLSRRHLGCLAPVAHTAGVGGRPEWEAEVGGRKDYGGRSGGGRRDRGGARLGSGSRRRRPGVQRRVDRIGVGK